MRLVTVTRWTNVPFRDTSPRPQIARQNRLRYRLSRGAFSQLSVAPCDQEENMATQRFYRALLPLGFLLLILIAAISIWLSWQQQAATGWVRHTLEVQNRVNLIRSLLTEAES